MMNINPSDAGFQNLLERSDQVFSKVRSILALQTPDEEARHAMTDLVAEGNAIADEMNTTVIAKQRVFKLTLTGLRQL